jgi:S-adenosylmethionine synthetase
MGEITTSAAVDYQKIIRDTVHAVGYVHSDYGFDSETCGVLVSLKEQSPDISRGVTQALEVREKTDEDDLDRLGAGDQGIMVGFACNETPELMPMPIVLAHHLSSRLASVRKDGTLSYLRPDGKSQVAIEYQKGVPKRVDSVVIAAQHDQDVSRETIERDVREHVVDAVVPLELRDENTKYFVNPTGRFVIGGPMGDAGLTGRKILVDTYGGGFPHGGGAFSGKDPTKVDRSGAYAGRYVAKNVVAAGLADRLEIQIAYVIGVAHPVSIAVETYGTGKVSDSEIQRLIAVHFDLRPQAIIQDLGLRKPIFRQTAAYGHFGRSDLDLPWERIDKADALRADAKL